MRWAAETGAVVCHGPLSGPAAGLGAIVPPPRHGVTTHLLINDPPDRLIKGRLRGCIFQIYTADNFGTGNNIVSQNTWGIHSSKVTEAEVHYGP